MCVDETYTHVLFLLGLCADVCLSVFAVSHVSLRDVCNQGGFDRCPL